MPQKTFSVNFESSGFRSASRKMSKMGDEADTAGSSLQTAGKVGAAAVAAIGTAVTGAVAGMGKLISSTAEYAKEVDNAAAQSGMTAESIQEVAYAANQVSGTDFESTRDGLKELALRSAEAAEGTGEAQEAFDRLGISQEELQGMSTAETFQRVREEMQGLTKSQRILTAEQVFGGEAGEKLAETMGLTAQEMQGLRNEAQESGKVLSGSQVQALESARSAWSSLTSSVSGTGRQLAARMAPVVTGTVIPALESMLDTVSSTVERLTSMSDTTKGIVATVTGLTAAVSAGLAVWAAWPAIIGGVTAAFTGLTTAASTAWATITSPVTAVIAAVAAVAASAYLIYDNWGKVSDFFSSIWDAVTTSAEAFGAVLVGLFERAWLEVKALFAESINGLIDLINKGLRAIGAENMQIEGEVGVPSKAIEENNKRLGKLRKDLNEATSQATTDVLQSGGEMMSGFEDTVRETYGNVKGMMSSIGGFLSIGSPQQQSDNSNTTTGGTNERSGSASAGQDEELIDQEMPNLNAELDTTQEKLNATKRVGKTATSSLKRGFNGVFRGLGRMTSGLITGKERVQSFGQVASRALESVVSKLSTMVIKLGAIKGLKAAFSIGTGGIGGLLGGVLGFAKGGIVTGPTLGVIGEGTEDEAVMPLSKLNQFVQGGGGGGGTVQSAGSAQISQGNIQIPVEVVDRAQRKGARNLSRSGR